MNDINSVVLVGRFTKEPEVKYTSGGMAIMNGTIATNRRVKKGEQWADEASFFDLKYFGKGAEAVSKLITKGSKATIAGELVQERWEKDGQQRSKVLINCSYVQLTGGKKSGHQNDDAETFQDDPIPF